MTQDSKSFYVNEVCEGESTRAHSPEPVELRLRTALAQSHYRALRSITCRVVAGEATLEGDLDSYYQKQVAQTIAARVPGVVRVHNRIQVGAGRTGQAHVSSRHGA